MLFRSTEYDITTGSTVFVDQNTITARFDATGALDATFGTGGFVETNLGFNSNGQSLAIDGLDRIVVSTSNRLLRFDNTGTLDPTFDTDGIANTVTSASHVAIDGNGKIVTAGSDRLARYNDDGSPDTDFAPGGQLDTNIASFTSLMIDHTNRIVVAGQTFTTDSTGANFLVARYITQGLPVTVLNLRPEITDLNGPATGVEGTAFDLDVTATDPAGPVADPLTYSWSITLDGNPYQLASGDSVSITPLDDGTYVATATVSDGDGGTAVQSHTTVVSNVAPTGTFHAPTSIDEGDLLTLSIIAPDDPSGTDTTVGFEYAFDLGSGYGAFSTSNTANITTTDNGILAVKGKIRDKDGDETEYTANVTVNNVAPTVAELSVTPESIAENGTTILTGTITDPGTLDTFTLDVSWDDGDTDSIDLGAPLPAGVTFDAGTGEFTAVHQYFDDGESPGNATSSDEYAVTVTVTDDDGDSIEPASRVSVDSLGLEGNSSSSVVSQATSSDGRYVVFHSGATNLVAGDVNNQFDVFLYDRQTGTTTRVSEDNSGVGGNNLSLAPTISANGRFVVYESSATNLIPGGTNGRTQIFVYDQQTGQTTLASANAAGNQGNVNSGDAFRSPAISADGRYVAFESHASNLVSGDINGKQDVFVKDLHTGQVTRVSVDSTGTESNDGSNHPSISADGRFVAFFSSADNLVSGDNNGQPDIFVHDLQAATTSRVSVDSAGNEANHQSLLASISGDGRFVAFASDASNLVPGDTNARDIFVHDRDTGTTTKVSVDSGGVSGDSVSDKPSISADGRYVAFESFATNLVPADVNGQKDVFVHDRQTAKTSLASVGIGGLQGNSSSFSPSISADGRTVVYGSNADNLISDDTNAATDVFIYQPLVATVTVNNVAPTFDAGGAGPDESLNPTVAGAFSRTGITFNDPGTLDVHTVEVDWNGDTVVDQTFTVTPAGTNVRTFDLNHTFTTEGTFSVTVTLKDDDLGEVLDTFDVTVLLNQPPVISTLNLSADENQTSAGTVVANDPDASDTLSYSLTGNGADAGLFSIDSSTGDLSFNTPQDFENPGDDDSDGVYVVQVQVTDGTASHGKTIYVHLNDLEATLTIGDKSGLENAGPLAFDVVLAGDNIHEAFDVTYSTTDGTARDAGAGVGSNDYDGTAAGMISFDGDAASETQQISITVNDDTAVEQDEDFFLNLLSTTSNDISFTDATGEGTIENDDNATFTINGVDEMEGTGGTTDFDFTVSLDNPIQGGFDLAFLVNDGAASDADDFDVITVSPLNFSGSAGETHVITVRVDGDSTVESDELFTVGLVDDGTNIPDEISLLADNGNQGLAFGIIRNDDTAAVSIDNSSVTEGGNLVFDVSLTNLVDVDTVITYSTADGSATTTDNDYTGQTSQTLTILAGQTGGTITVATISDSNVELNETLDVNLIGVFASGRDGDVTIADNQGLGTITNDDSATVSIDDVLQVETDSGQTAFEFSVSLSAPVDTTVSLQADTADDSATIADGDYDSVVAESVSFAAGTTSPQSVTIQVNGDLLVEPDQNFFLKLSSLLADARDVSFAETQGLGTILNDDFFSGRVFDDLDNDGVFDPADSDAGIEGVLMQLVNETSGAVVDTDTTDVDGLYDFDVTLQAGTYKIVEVVDELVDLGLLDGRETAGVNGGTVDNSQDSNEISNIDVNGSGTADDQAADYLFAELGGSDVFGTVWRDFNNDGEINFGENGINAVTLTLTGTDDRGNPVSDTDVTAVDGSYAFVDLRPGTYAIEETQPAGFDDGQESLGEVTDLGLPTAVGDSGFIDGNDKFSGLGLVPKSEADPYNFGERPQTDGGIGDSVTATIGFWHNKNGQALIKSLNGAANATQLGNWLATTFPNMYGPGAFYDAARGDDQNLDLTSKTNEELAEIFKYLHNRNKKTAVTGGPVKVDAQVMAVALATYATSENLAGGNYAAAYGFNTSADGIAYTTFNVLDELSTQEADNLGLTPAMDAAGHTTIMDILLATDSKAAEGLLYDVDDDDSIDSFESVLRQLANELYTAINEGSDI